MNAKWIMTVTISFLMITASMYFAIPSISNPDTTTQSPSAYENNAWNSPTNAYSSNNLRASESTSLDQVTYKTYGFQSVISDGDTIDNVYVKCEGYVSAVAKKVYGRISWDGGTSWYPTGSTWHDFALGTSESTKTWDVSAATTWTRDKLNDTNFRVKLKYYAPAGCYPNQTYYLGFDKFQDQWVLKNIGKAKVGDSILVLDDFTKEIKLSTIRQIDIHFGKWTLLDIYSGNLTVAKEEMVDTKEDWTWKAHVCFTDEHPVEWAYNEAGTLKRRGEAGDLQVGYYLAHLWHEKPYFRNEPVSLRENTIKWFPITRIDVNKNYRDAVYNLWAEEDHYRPFLKFLTDKEMDELIIIGEKMGVGLEMLFDPPPIGKVTGYVDWLPVEVHYTPGAAEEWNDIAEWTFNLTTMQWNDVNAWTLNLTTRQWNAVGDWVFNLTGMQWNDVALWVFNLTTMQWNHIAVWDFNLISRQWTGIAVWDFDLIGRNWQNIVNWAFNLTGREWTDISSWAFDVVSRNWFDIASWWFRVWSHAQNPPGGDLLEDDAGGIVVKPEIPYTRLGIFLLILVVVLGSATAYKKWKQKIKRKLRKVRKDMKKKNPWE